VVKSRYAPVAVETSAYWSRRLEHLLEPLPHRAVAEDRLEGRVERPQVEQRLDHVEDQNTHHTSP
jgi:hypothetical protein